MEKISIFNYEAFYLDHLEGNLNAEDTALLLAFLEEHPELKVEDDDFPMLEEEGLQLDAQFKSDLKQIAFNETTITTENIEKFMIAEAEGLLSNQKIKEMDQFIGDNSSLRRSRALFIATRLKPDHSIIFTDKDSLRRNRRLAIWPYVAFAAAASVAAIFFIFQSNNDQILKNNGGTELAGGDSLKKIEERKSLEDLNQEKQADQLPVDDVFVPGRTFAEISEKEEIPEHVNVKNQNQEKQEKIDRIKLRAPKNIQLAKHDLEILEEASPYVPTKVETIRNSDYASLGFQEMNNPIKPVTSRLGDLVNQEVDFRTAKASEKNSGGFYLKIGKFELSHKKH
jgi:hypothetical protein